MPHYKEMQLIPIPTHSVFIVHVYLQHVGAALSGTKPIYYYMYLINHEQMMMGAVAFAYGWSFRTAGDPVPQISSIFEVKEDADSAVCSG